MSVFEKSKFIWINDTESVDTYAEFYAKIQIAGKPAICNISVDGDYTLFINGTLVASNQYGDYEHYKVYDTIDISNFIHTGANDFALLCWHFGEDTSRYKTFDAGVIFEVVEDGRLVLASDESIVARKSRAYVSGFKRRISPQLGFSFKYDSSSEDAWTLGCGEGFESAICVDKKCTFFPRPIKKLSLGEPVWARAVLKTEKSTVYDLGREYVGLVTLEAQGEGVANISYGECLENNSVKRTPDWHDFSLDYVCSGEKSYTNYMLRLACRYLEISTQDSAKIKRVGIIPQYFETKRKDFSFLSGIDAQIYEICARTLELCMMEHYVDCPWREQCLYAFDSRNQMLCGYYAFEGGIFEYARACLRLLSESQRPDGLLAICSPCGVNLAIPSFSLHFINSLCEYSEYSGDISLFKEKKECVRAILDAFLSKMQDGLPRRYTDEGFWNFYDWSPCLSGDFGRAQPNGTDTILCSLIILALDSYERLCALANLPFELDGVANTIRANAKRAFFDTESSLFSVSDEIKDKVELANALAILAGICTDDEARVICDSLSNDALTPCSLSMKCFKYDALIKCDKEKYKGAILGEIRKAYEKMIETGTVWETEVGASDFGNAGSLCHGWSSIPIYYYNVLK